MNPYLANIAKPPPKTVWKWPEYSCLNILEERLDIDLSEYKNCKTDVEAYKLGLKRQGTKWYENRFVEAGWIKISKRDYRSLAIIYPHNNYPILTKKGYTTPGNLPFIAKIDYDKKFIVLTEIGYDILMEPVIHDIWRAPNE